MGVTLHERVDERQYCTPERQIESQRVGEQHHHQEGCHAEAREQGDSFPGFNATGGQWAVFGAFDVSIHLAVGKIVDGATGSSHHEYAEGKDDKVANAGEAVCGQPKCPVGWP